jgi:DNA gyrase/topoisomerase IV subunit B/DNA gyrase/topoisomerase IV subunit A
MEAKKITKVTKTVEETFQKKTQLEHIIDIPDTYIGSIEKTDIDTWIYDEENEKIIYKNIKYIPGLYKIFDEVLVNAIDQHVRTENDEKIINKVNMIKVNFDVENNLISVYNNGEGIPIVEHKEHNVWIPELIFGHLLTSSNYDKDEKKITGGKNGYGAKLANIFSKKFKIETVDAERKLKYIQTFEKNMTIKNQPIISSSGNSKPYTIIEFSPDLERFGIEKLSDETILLMKKRVFDITACTNKNVSVFLDDKKIECKTLEKYVNYYLDNSVERIYEEVNDRWEVVVAVNPDTKFEQVSFVNGISTLKGGKHVDYVVNSVVKKVQNYVSTTGVKRKKLDLKPVHIKDNLFIFIRSTIENPAFDSQIKEYLTTASTKFGSKCEVSEKFIEKLIKNTSLIERATKLSDFKDNLGLQKVSGKKTTAIRGIDKLDDANKAGGNESLKCTLILTEGDSAKALAIAGLSVVGRDYFGVFPLRGKLLNPRDVDIKKVGANAEISNLVKIMGLKFGEKNKKKNKEETLKELRYGKIMIFTDADVDGSHIKGLLINLFAMFWPELLEIPGFIISLATPIIKVKSKEKKNGETKEFYTMTEFNDWKSIVENIRKWDIKYYKGLGTSTSEEGKEYFVDFDNKNINYLLGTGDEDEENKNKSINKIDLAFDKKRAEDRKMWLKTYNKDNIIEQSQKNILYHEFIDRELIHFSDYDCKRSIACICDGLKPSLRKIIYSCFKRNLKKEIKVAQLAGYVSENSAYHHGEQSLYESIIGLAQDFVGSNNINLLMPKGQFGCLSPDTPILMWDGTNKRADEIRIGDILVGDDGTQRNVLKITSGVDDMYEITCKNNKNYTVNSQHILTLYYKNNNNVSWYERTKDWRLEYFDGKKIITKMVRTVSDITNHKKTQITKEEGYKIIIEYQKDIISKYNCSQFIDIKLEDYIKLSNNQKKKLYMVSNTNPIQWEKKDVKIDPYILGAWLGDGCHDGSGFSSADHEIVKAFAIWADTINCEITHHVNVNNHEGYQYGIRRKKSGYKTSIGDINHTSDTCIGCKTSCKKHLACDWHFEKSNEIFDNTSISKNGMIRNDMNPFKNILKEMNLLKNKHIPHDYIYNDIDTRLKLLAGFIDTDGRLRKNNNGSFCYEITQSERLHGHLIDQLDIIAKSLGMATSISIKDENKITKDGNKIITKIISIYGDNLLNIPILLERKKQYEYKRKEISMNYFKFDIKYIGKNNFNGWMVDNNQRFLLGNFIVTHNSRLTGEDAASPRYIFTCLNELTYHIFNPLDNPLLEYNEDDGQKIEPIWYIPIIPMILVNGTEGIGTGYSTKIPQHDPEVIVRNLFNLMDDKPLEKMVPWFRGFKGTIEFKGINDYGCEQYINKGSFKYVDDTTVLINELPIGKWTEDYKTFLESLLFDKSIEKEKKADKQCLVDFSNNSSDKLVLFTLKFKKDDLANMRMNKEIESTFKLTDSKNTNYFNMNLYNSNGIITKYDRVEDILKEFYFIRLVYYEKRKNYMLKNIQRELDIYSAKIRFIDEFISGEINILHKDDDEIEEMLEERNYPKFNVKSEEIKNNIENNEEDEENEENEDTKNNEEQKVNKKSLNSDYNYEYLLNMKIKSLTKKKIEELKKLHENKLALYNELQIKTDKQLWKEDLMKFLELYKIKLQEYYEVLNKQIKPNSTAKSVKKVTVVKKKVNVV